MRKRLQSLPLRGKIILTLLALVMVSSTVFAVWLFSDLPSIDDLEAGLALPSTRIYDRNGKLLYEILPPEQGRNVSLTLEAIPDHCENAVIAVEDVNFYTHPGVDIVGIVRALAINLRGGEVIAGGSTITQQVARNALFDPQERAERTLERKLKEAVLALQLQSRYSKEDVLALYLNQAYLGNLAYGIEGGARAYFGKSASDLSLAECALLAGIVQNANLHDPFTNTESALERRSVVLDLMLAHDFITTEQHSIASAEELQFASVPFPIKAPHFVMAVWKQLEREYPDQLYTQGLDVITTVDLDWQETAEEVANLHLNYLNNPPEGERVPANAQNAAVVAIDPYTGQVLTMLGSPDYFDESIDGAVNAALALRQPGSALKPFTYAAAMDIAQPEPWTAATMILDVRTPFITRKLESYVPSNFGFAEHGPVLAREALASSLNIPAVVALEHAGIENMVQLSANAGLISLAQSQNVDLAVTLGGSEVRLLDMAQAYSIFPNGGYYVQPSMILNVKTRDGDTLYQWQRPALDNQVLDSRIASLITDILSDPEARIKGFGRYNLLNIGRPVAAKTGTTTDFRDNWTMGYTPNLVVGVWVGNANNTSMVDVTGISGAAPIWHDFMRRVLAGKPELEFTLHPDLVSVEICALSGLLPTPECTQTRQEWFIEGTAPTEYDTFFQTFEIDRATGQLADASTPPERIRREVYAVLPAEARDWAIRSGFPMPPRNIASGAREVNASTARYAGVRLLSPDPYNLYQIAPNQPPETQRLRFSIATPQGTQAVSYYLNDELIGTSETAPFDLWWQLRAGEYVLTATVTDADGVTQSAVNDIPFSVMDYLPPEERLPALNGDL